MQKGFAGAFVLIGVLIVGLGITGAWYTKIIQIPNFPPPGCYYKQVQCIQAPCNPILTCGTSSSNPVVTPQTTPSLTLPKGSEEYCRQFGSDSGSCPSDCELRSSCPICLDIGCHAKQTSSPSPKVSPTPPVDGTTERNLSFETIRVNQFTEYALSVQEPLVANDIETWEKIVNQPEVTVNFSNSTVIAVFMAATTGGHKIQVQEVVNTGDRVEVVVLKTHPGKNCFVTQATTFNTHIIKLQKINKPINFIVKEEIIDCNR